MRMPRHMLGAAAGAAALSLVLIGTASPAQAFPDNLKISIKGTGTSICPCTYTDPIDNTYFKYDPGGHAEKLELRDPDTNEYLGKMEFHPYGEKLWIYDTKNDNDTFYVRYRFTNAQGKEIDYGGFHAPGTSNKVDIKVIDLDVPEGNSVFIYLYDTKPRTDFIESVGATA